jgi:predicted oxidoreductase
MNTQNLGNSPLNASRIAYGCMEIGGSWDQKPPSPETKKQAIAVIEAALEEGITFFDHADIYCRGKSEVVFSGIWEGQPNLRDNIIIQSKCGIRFADDLVVGYPPRYDFSYDHILNSVDGILNRLKTDYLDILLLHRPDALVEPEDVAKAFDELHSSGKVRYFGVSNHTPSQIELLQKYLNQPLIVNQLEFNLLHTHLINEGIIANQDKPLYPVRGNGTLEFCRTNEITIQAWSPLARGQASGANFDPEDQHISNTVMLVKKLAEEKDVSREAIVIAWILKHPAKIQPVIGTTNISRIKAACQADDVELSREEWYALFTAGRGEKLP